MKALSAAVHLKYLCRMGEKGLLDTTYYYTLRSFVFQGIAQRNLFLYGATAHVMRHSYLTYLAGTGTDGKTLQTIAGHSTVTMTMNKYVHAQPEKIKEAGNKMHALLAS